MLPRAKTNINGVTPNLCPKGCDSLLKHLGSLLSKGMKPISQSFSGESLSALEAYIKKYFVCPLPTLDFWVGSVGRKNVLFFSSIIPQKGRSGKTTCLYMYVIYNFIKIIFIYFIFHFLTCDFNQ